MTKKKTAKKSKKALAKAKGRTPARKKAPAKKEEPNSDGRLNLRIDPALKEWAQEYADRRGTSVTQIVVNYLTELRAADEDRLSADAEPL